MGLLDDAIREHLELRRRHGADPDEVAREELDALAPVPRDGGPASGGPADDDDGRTLFDAERVADHATAVDDMPGSRATSLMQETAEIDMHAILAREVLDDPSALGGLGHRRAAAPAP